MGDRWNPLGFRLLSLLVLILVLRFRGCWCLNDEGLILLSFRENIKFDPFGALENWSPNDGDPCLWNGVHCVDGKVHMLNLTDFSLEGTLVPELWKLNHLRSLVLYKNCLSGAIPKEIGGLTRLELLDLRNNNLNGMIPVELGSMLSLKCLLLCDNRFEGTIPLELTRLSSLCELQFDDYLSSSETTGFGSVNRKFGHWYNTAYTYKSLLIWQSNLEHVNSVESLVLFLKGAFKNYLNYLSLPRFSHRRDPLPIDGDNCCDSLSSLFESHMAFARRRLLAQASNLPAVPVTDTEPTGQVIALPTTRSSGAFPAVPKDKKKNSPPSPPAPAPQPSPEPHEASKHDGQSSQKSNGNMWKYLIIGFSVLILLLVLMAMVFMCRSQVAKTVGPWKTGLSGQLQKAFISGVPKLNRSELETACEDFSNIISTLEGCIVYKGTLSSGVEIAVASTTISSLKDWSKLAENFYRKKIDVLSRVNHKNFVNLIGYCEEDEPFTRMMVFEYAPNGNLFEHLHIEEMEHLDWNSRIRIVMGTAYCLQYMHHELNPPVSHPNLTSASIFLTDDYAAKIAEICFWAESIRKPKNSGDDDKEHSVLPPLADPETNVYSFGVMLLEIITGKLQNSEEHGSLLYWASAYLNENRSDMVDPTLKSFKNEELDVLCEVIKDCIQEDPRQRPTMKDVTNKLREVIPITPNQAVPRLSPLWWAELEILSVEAT